MADSGAQQQPAAPPEREFDGRDELLAFVRGFAVARGYAVVISKSNVPRGQVWLRCDLGGRQKRAGAPGAKRKRQAASRRLECPFQLYGRRLPSARWALRVQDARHNHDVAAAAEQLAAHPVARRLSLEQKLLVQELTERGARPAAIVELLKARFPGKPLKVQDIYNARNHIRRERDAGREPFARPGGCSVASDAPSPLSGGQQAARLDVGVALRSELPQPLAGGDVEAGDLAPPRDLQSTARRLQHALQRVSREFPRWEMQRQHCFMSQLEHLLGECSPTDAADEAREVQRTVSSDDYDDEEAAALAVVDQTTLMGREPSSLLGRAADDLLMAPPPLDPSPPPSPPSSSMSPAGMPSLPPSSGRSEADKGLDTPAQPSISL